MPIHKPGETFRYSRILSRRKGKREVVAILSLTAMVDMFTVLVIFLLQNYNTTGEVIYIPKEVTLPKAQKIRELQPAVVVTISNKEILVDQASVVSYENLKTQNEWMIAPLFTRLSQALDKAKTNYERKLQNRLRQVVDSGQPAEQERPWSKVTIQADKGMDFLTVKKVMYTVTEAGAGEINFAVTKERASQ